MTFAIHLKPDAFARRRLVSGPIWLELGGLSFPAHEWDDFPVVVLGFWLNNLKPLLLGQSTACECLFMDGPYQFNIHRYSRKQLSVTLVKRGVDEEKELLTANVTSVLLVRQMISASEIAVQTCKRNQWIDNDLLTLEQLIVDAKALALKA